LRVGVATGPIAAGTVGGADRQSYTVYGSTVNMAKRLEEANKDHGTRLLACERTALEGGGAGYELAGHVTARGLPAQVPVFGWRTGAVDRGSRAPQPSQA
jgi:class 3 adenylate cyclase